jgi:GDP-4-dehydro-6-deoxy-D-mannose reductase
MALHTKKVLISGSNGFVGQYLKEYLNSQKMEVIEFPSAMDIRSKDNVSLFFKKNSVDYVIHLAAQTFVPRSIESPRETYEINFYGTVNILDALLKSNFKGTFLFVSSSDVFGTISENEFPIKETSIFQPNSPYAVSKIAAELHCRSLSLSSTEMNIVVARPFNHIGPRQNKNFVIARFCREVAMMKKGLIKPFLKVGNLNVSRDFVDVRDVVMAYHLLLNKGDNGEVYNICSGTEVFLKDVLIKLKDFSDIDFDIEVSSELYRSIDQPRVIGSFDKVNKKTGWTPTISFDKSLFDTFNYWLNE